MGKYYSSKDVVYDEYVPVPTFLVETMGISFAAAYLYGKIKARMRLSEMNRERFEDDNGIFVIYRHKDLAEMIHRDERTVRRLVSELEKAELILSIQEVKGRQAKIYLRNLYTFQASTQDIFVLHAGQKCPTVAGQKCPTVAGQKCPTNKRDIEKEDIKKEEYRSKRFTPPTLEEVKQYVSEKHLCYVNPEVFFNYYESNGWKVQGRTMQKWKAACSGWNAREAEKHHTVPSYSNGYGTMESGF